MTIWQQACIWQEVVWMKLIVKKYCKDPQRDNPSSHMSSCELIHTSHPIAAFTACPLGGVHTVHRWPALTYATGATFHITEMLLQSSQYICVEINSVYCCVSVPVWLIRTYICVKIQSSYCCVQYQFNYYTNWGLTACHSICHICIPWSLSHNWTLLCTVCLQYNKQRALSSSQNCWEACHPIW